MSEPVKKIIFFDGECNLCDRFINSIFKRDPSRQFFYAPLQGSTAHNLLKGEKNLKSIVFLKGETSFRESKAIAEIMSLLYPKTIKIFRFLPYPFYDIFYRWMARKRYRFFGKKSHLYKPSEEQKKYFLP